MGYYTEFSLTVLEDAFDFEQFLNFNTHKTLPYKELKKQVNDIEEYFEKMEDLHSQYQKVLGESVYLGGDTGLHFLVSLYEQDFPSEKWYEHEIDMKLLSTLFPTVTFSLSGVGEEKDDQWKKYFRNGKMQVAKAVIHYEPFDPKLLK